MRIFTTKSKLGLLRPDKICDNPEGCISSIRASDVALSPLFFSRNSNFAFIINNFYKGIKIIFVKQIFLTKVNIAKVLITFTFVNY